MKEVKDNYEEHVLHNYYDPDCSACYSEQEDEMRAQKLAEEAEQRDRDEKTI